MHTEEYAEIEKTMMESKLKGKLKEQFWQSETYMITRSRIQAPVPKLTLSRPCPLQCENVGGYRIRISLTMQSTSISYFRVPIGKSREIAFIERMHHQETCMH